MALCKINFLSIDSGYGTESFFTSSTSSWSWMNGVAEWSSVLARKIFTAISPIPEVICETEIAKKNFINLQTSLISVGAKRCVFLQLN